MDFSGWEVDLPALYGKAWEKRARFLMNERLYEQPGYDRAVLFFGLGEVGMNKEVGPIAVFRNKKAPSLVFHSGKTCFWYEGLPGEPVLFQEGGRSARVYEFIPGGLNGLTKLGFRERVLDLEEGALIPLETPPR